MASYASAEEIHRLRLLRGNNYQGGYQPQWVRLTADTVHAIDVKSEEKSAEVPVTRERSESIKSEDSSTSSTATATENVEFKGLRML